VLKVQVDCTHFITEVSANSVEKLDKKKESNEGRRKNRAFTVTTGCLHLQADTTKQFK